MWNNERSLPREHGSFLKWETSLSIRLLMLRYFQRTNTNKSTLNPIEIMFSVISVPLDKTVQIDNGRQRARICILRLKSQIIHKRMFQRLLTSKQQKRLTRIMQEMTKNPEEDYSLSNWCLSFWIWLFVIAAQFCLVFSATPLLFQCFLLFDGLRSDPEWYVHSRQQCEHAHVFVCAWRHVRKAANS